MPNLRKDNHYVPKVYLKQWAKSGKISAYRLLVPSDNVPHWKAHSLKGVAYHQHLYTYLAGREETDEFERWLDTEFENPAEEAIHRIVKEEQMSSDHWERLVRFAVALDVRTPASLRRFLRVQHENLATTMTETLMKSVQKLEEAVRRSEQIPISQEKNDDRSMFKVIIGKSADGGGQIRSETIVGRRLWIWQMKHILKTTIQEIPLKKWTILHAPPGITWPTSDNPLIRLKYYDEDNYDFEGGWALDKGEVLLPLSPKHLLYRNFGGVVRLRGTTVDMRTAEIISRIIIEHADRYVFSREEIDIHKIRSRVVCPVTWRKEQEAWQQWHEDQTRAERDFQME